LIRYFDNLSFIDICTRKPSVYLRITILTYSSTVVIKTKQKALPTCLLGPCIFVDDFATEGVVETVGTETEALGRLVTGEGAGGVSRMPDKSGWRGLELG
jgi:hypothetical protein